MPEHRQRSHVEHRKLFLFGDNAQVEGKGGEIRGGCGKGSGSQKFLSQGMSAFR